MQEPTAQRFDVNKGDDTAIFYSRMFGEKRVVIIPKDLFTFDETEATYVLTLKE